MKNKKIYSTTIIFFILINSLIIYWIENNSHFFKSEIIISIINDKEDKNKLISNNPKMNLLKMIFTSDLLKTKFIDNVNSYEIKSIKSFNRKIKLSTMPDIDHAKFEIIFKSPETFYSVKKEIIEVLNKNDIKYKMLHLTDEDFFIDISFAQKYYLILLIFIGFQFYVSIFYIPFVLKNYKKFQIFK